MKRVVLASAVLGGAALGLTSKQARSDVEIVTEYSQSYVHTARKAGAANGIEGLTQRDQGISWRPRLALKLSERHGRRMSFLLGGYFRRPVIYSLSGAGSDLTGVSATELGVEVGVSWFGFARTLFQISPEWILSYEAANLFEDDPGRRTSLRIIHRSLGFRLEVPIPFLTLDSEPGDRRVEMGIAACYLADSVGKFILKPVNFSADDVPDTAFDTEIEDTQEQSKRWMVGAFLNVRI